MKISIITTMYHSASYLEEFYERCLAVIKEIELDYEFIFVNDGSPDDSLEKALSLLERDRSVKVVELSRNFGHHRAIMTGLENTSGDYVFLIDCDLEEEPELLKLFWTELQVNNCDVVYGVQEKRRGGLIEKLTGRLFYKLFNFFSYTHIPDSPVTARLMTRAYCDDVVRYQENDVFIYGTFADVGYIQKAVKIIKHKSSPTTYNFGRKLNYTFNAITAFSSKPLEYIFYLGLVISIFALGVIIYVIAEAIINDIEVEGWLTLVISIWLVGGLMILSVGTVGLYLSKIFIEAKKRPRAIIKRLHTRK